MTGISEQEMEEAWAFDQAMHEAQREAFCEYEEANRRLAELMRSLIYYVSKGILNEEKIRTGVFKSETPEERKKAAEDRALLEMTLNFPDRSSVQDILHKALDIIEKEK